MTDETYLNNKKAPRDFLKPDKEGCIFMVFNTLIRNKRKGVAHFNTYNTY